MLKPFERFWSYGSDWILRETSPERNQPWVVYLGFSVACQLEILKVGRFRNSAFFPRCQSEVDVKQIRHKHGQVFLRALNWDGLQLKSKWNYFVESETNSCLQKSTATCPIVHPTVYLARSSLKAIAQKKRKKKCNLSCSTGSNCCTWRWHRHPWTTCWGDATIIRTISGHDKLWR